MIILPILGIDVSEHQGNIDWSRVYKSGIKFAMIRASYGYSNIDKTFSQNATNAVKNGVLVGAYHYCYAADVKSAQIEAYHFLDTIKNYKIQYPIALDIEDKNQDSLSKKSITDVAFNFLNILALAKYYVMIYSSVSWFSYKLDDKRLIGYDHWIAQWGPKNTYDGITGIWQFSNEGVIDGINTPVDLNYGYKNFDDIIKSRKLNNLSSSSG